MGVGRGEGGGGKGGSAASWRAMLQQDKVHDRPGSLRDRIGQWSSPQWQGYFQLSPDRETSNKIWTWHPQVISCEFSVNDVWGWASWAKSGSKFKFGFPQLPPKFITLMYSPKLAMEYHIFIDAFSVNLEKLNNRNDIWHYNSKWDLDTRSYLQSKHKN